MLLTETIFGEFREEIEATEAGICGRQEHISSSSTRFSLYLNPFIHTHSCFSISNDDAALGVTWEFEVSTTHIPPPSREVLVVPCQRSTFAALFLEYVHFKFRFRFDGGTGFSVGAGPELRFSVLIP